jgi:hypothetical protein
VNLFSAKEKDKAIKKRIREMDEDTDEQTERQKRMRKMTVNTDDISLLAGILGQSADANMEED